MDFYKQRTKSLLSLLVIFTAFFSNSVLSFTYKPEYSPDSLSIAKRDLRQIYSNNRVDFYCECPFDKDLKMIDGKCSFKSVTKAPRHDSIDWEHVVPVSVFGKSRDCWNKPLCTTKEGNKYKGRYCCKKIDPIFEEMESDMKNLVPALHELNVARSNYTPTDTIDNPVQIASCPLYVDRKAKTVYPLESKRGEIARIYLYFEEKYRIQLEPEVKERMLAWNEAYPITEWELEKDTLIRNLKFKRTPQKPASDILVPMLE